VRTASNTALRAPAIALPGARYIYAPAGQALNSRLDKIMTN
jgi:hypothetical protein